MRANGGSTGAVGVESKKQEQQDHNDQVLLTG